MIFEKGLIFCFFDLKPFAGPFLADEEFSSLLIFLSAVILFVLALSFFKTSCTVFSIIELIVSSLLTNLFSLSSCLILSVILSVSGVSFTEIGEFLCFSSVCE